MTVERSDLEAIALQVANIRALVDEIRKGTISLEALAAHPDDDTSSAIALYDIVDEILKLKGSREDQRQALLTRIRKDLLASHAKIDVADLDRVLQAMASVDREAFIVDPLAEFAYLPFAMAIGHGQTISQPRVVALMTLAGAIKSGDRVLEVGTGSGYHTAILSQLATTVVSVEIVEALAAQASLLLSRLGFCNVCVLHGDGGAGEPSQGPYDVILVAAASDAPPKALLAQLVIGGRLVMPIGKSADAEDLTVFIKRTALRVERHRLERVSFVPMTGMGARR